MRMETETKWNEMWNIRQAMFTRVLIGGADGDDARADGDVFVEFVAVAHRIEEWRVVVQVEHVEVDGHGGRQTRSARVLSLDHENVVLHLHRRADRSSMKQEQMMAIKKNRSVNKYKNRNNKTNK